jgi:hypothetical protein
VLRLPAIEESKLLALLVRYGLRLSKLAPGETIPGSYWGESEAGLQRDQLFVRADTPLHSILHEASHYVCMSPARRAALDRDAGGDDLEECGVCYLQVLLSDLVPGSGGREQQFADMDEWGYSFRLGSARAWFEHDATDARTWLTEHGLIDTSGAVTFALRKA